MINNILTAAAAAAVSVATGPVGWAIAGTIALAALIIGGIKIGQEIAENKQEKINEENLKKAEELLNTADNITGNTGTAETEKKDELTWQQKVAEKKKEEALKIYNEAKGDTTRQNTNSNVIEVVPGISGTLDTEKDDTWVETMQPGQNGNNEDENERIDAPPNIGDKTTENWESAIQTEDFDWRAWAEEQQQKQWQREDDIRKEIQAREDSAYQRAIADMRKAGINPNLISIQPAQSGGGITQATGVDTSMLSNQLKIDSEKLQQLIDQAFKEDENSKERFTEIFTSLISTLAMVMLFKK